MLKRKILAVILALCLLLSVTGAPAIAEQSQESPTTATEYQDPLANQSQGDSGSDNPASTGGYTTQPVGDPQGLENSQGTNSNPMIIDGVAVDINKNIGVIANSNASATTGDSSSTGTNITNNVNSNPDSAATGDSSAADQSDATAANESQNIIDNSANANAESGNAAAASLMDKNDIKIAPEETVTIDVQGKIINSDVIVKVLYDYTAILTGAANAATGDTTATGLQAENTINTSDSATAIADAALLSEGGLANGSAESQNQTANTINNKTTSDAQSGNANATNVMAGNDIYIAPIIDSLVRFCGDIINSTVEINLIYKFLAEIAGQANATSGGANSLGAQVLNAINNYASSLAAGDAPVRAGDEGTVSDGSAEAINSTANSINNNSVSDAKSGDATANNTMLNNDIALTPTLTNVVEIKDNIENSNVLIKIVYNIVGQIFGSANAVSGDANATGLVAENSINNTSTATAIGDAPAKAKGEGEYYDGSAQSVNETGNSIDNTTYAKGESGDASATNTMTDNLIKVSPVIESYIVVMRPIIEQGLDGGPYVIEIVFDIWQVLSGAANAISGNATATGNIVDNAIDSESAATAYANVTVSDPLGPAQALNLTSNGITNNDKALAISGNANAESYLGDAKSLVTGDFANRLEIGEDTSDTTASVGIETKLLQASEAITGDASALGGTVASSLSANTSAEATGKDDNVAVNSSDGSISNNTVRESESGDVDVYSGNKPKPHKHDSNCGCPGSNTVATPSVGVTVYYHDGGSPSNTVIDTMYADAYDESKAATATVLAKKAKPKTVAKKVTKKKAKKITKKIKKKTKVKKLKKKAKLKKRYVKSKAKKHVLKTKKLRVSKR